MTILAAKTIAELKAIADEKGVKYRAKTLKKDLITYIVAKQLDSLQPKSGRPIGAKSATETVTTHATRCPACGSTERRRYLSKTEQTLIGFDTNGNKYTHIIRRRCQCENCGQVRIDREFENRI